MKKNSTNNEPKFKAGDEVVWDYYPSKVFTILRVEKVADGVYKYWNNFHERETYLTDADWLTKATKLHKALS